MADRNQTRQLTTTEVAALFRVAPTTVQRWAHAGKLTSTRSLNGHRRYPAAEIHTLLTASEDSAQPAQAEEAG